MKQNISGGIVVLLFLLYVAGGDIMGKYLRIKEYSHSTLVAIAIAWNLLFIFGIVIYVKYKKSKKIKRERQTNEVIDYAKESAVYHPNPPLSESQMKQQSSNNISGQTNDSYYTGKAYSTDRHILDEYAKERKRVTETDSTHFQSFPVSRILMVICTLVVCILLYNVLVQNGDINTSTADGMKHSFNALTGLIRTELPIAIIFFVIYRIYTRRSKRKQLGNDSVIYQKLIPGLVEDTFGPNSSFSRTQGLNIDEVFRLNCFGHQQTIVEGKNLISGTYKNVPFQCGCEHVEYEYKETDSDGYTVTQRATLFNGIIISVPFHKSSSSPLGLRSNSREEVGDSIENESKKYNRFHVQITETESVYFNRLFSIYSTDDENMFYILTPNMMEKLAALYTTSYISNQFHGIYICFDRDRMYMGIDSKLYLNFKAVEPSAATLDDLQQKIVQDLSTVKQILDYALAL